ncbi:hypothetical protein AWW66_30725 [Micromonospora rosaria]|uniref:Secreted protein n=1 Tax=Micromonospora rosaria TaxID=47874 RepID=A0A136PIP7_9ACTN|nr:hypothetical protein [Micromonospora rosaria]KXK58269.1 hypothetical protein AWW66_30725 [Micromonospora rosaria]
MSPLRALALATAALVAAAPTPVAPAGPTAAPTHRAPSAGADGDAPAAPRSAIRTAARYEWNNARAGVPPAGLHCAHTTGATACFVEDGDVWWVRDTATDGASAVADWVTLGDDMSVERAGACVNSLGRGSWGSCDKNYPDDAHVVWQACVYDRSADRWVRCD